MSSSEHVNRKVLVDQARTDAGWQVIRHARCQSGDQTAFDAVIEFSPDTDSSDHLLMLGSQSAADIEVEKPTAGPQNITGQAKRYAHGEFRFPFIYAANGQLVYLCSLWKRETNGNTDHRL